ncbi:extracellular metalloproteinase MEP [Ceratobasidium sp. AG-Ba]|nr:extracellular metalloproteinase MEP [Ceratobasidium sp. AG-Ba]
MLPVNKLAILASLIVSNVVAAPWNPTPRHATHRVRAIGPNKIELTSYHPPGVFQTFGEGVSPPLSRRATGDASPTEMAQKFLENKLGVSASELSRLSGHTSDAGSFEYFTQMINGVPVANAVANVAMKDGKVVSYGANFVKPKNIAPIQAKLSLDDAISSAEKATGATFNKWSPKREYVVKDTGDAVLVHAIQVQNNKTGEWYEVSVNGANGEITQIVNFVSDASYHVVPFAMQDPTKGYSIQTDPADKTASPNGWHAIGTTTTSETSGNNVIAYKGDDPSLAGTRLSKASSETNNYDYAYSPGVEPSSDPNVDAAIVNAFYTANMIHDWTYKYGFTEEAFNFQNDNGKSGGAGNDRVQLSVQDASGSNNANFATPPDGQPGQMRMYTWTYTTPNRDGALENDIITHEYGHGVSNRLTGGGTGRCLQTMEAGGMGEGWSDALADLAQVNSATLGDFALGSFVTNKTRDNESQSLVHAIGEVWALIWHEIIASLLSKYGYTEDRFDSEGTGGNIKAMHIFIAAFQIQPCNPTFLSARDAVIQADANKFGGANKCLLWQAFAKRGLGVGATASKVDNTDVPAGC